MAKETLQEQIKEQFERKGLTMKERLYATLAAQESYLYAKSALWTLAKSLALGAAYVLGGLVHCAIFHIEPVTFNWFLLVVMWPLPYTLLHFAVRS